MQRARKLTTHEPVSRPSFSNTPAPKKKTQGQTTPLSPLITPYSYIKAPSMDNMLAVITDGSKIITDSIPNNLDVTLTTVKNAIDTQIGILKTAVQNEITTGNSDITAGLTTILTPPRKKTKTEPSKSQKLNTEDEESLTDNEKVETMNYFKDEYKDLDDEDNLLGFNKPISIQTNEFMGDIIKTKTVDNKALYSKLKEKIDSMTTKAKALQGSATGAYTYSKNPSATPTPYAYDPDVVLPQVRTLLDNTTATEITNITTAVNTLATNLTTQIPASMDVFSATFSPIVQQVTTSEIAAMDDLIEARNADMLNQALTIVETP